MRDGRRKNETPFSVGTFAGNLTNAESKDYGKDQGNGYYQSRKDTWEARKGEAD
jgi:hypothetical protein